MDDIQAVLNDPYEAPSLTERRNEHPNRWATAAPTGRLGKCHEETSIEQMGMRSSQMIGRALNGESTPQRGGGGPPSGGCWCPPSSIVVYPYSGSY
jgi:hypothetical protein